MKEIGGYFELELSKGVEYHYNLIKLNSGRNCLKYILTIEQPKKMYLPNYVCDSVIEPLKELSINYEFYNIDKNFEIIQNVELLEDELLFYVNYFGMKKGYLNILSQKYHKNLIIDNTQAFFEKPLESIYTIYSPRKFFGVRDGGYLSTVKVTRQIFDYDESYLESIHLLGRIDKNASFVYDDYKKSENRLSYQPIKKMSRLTENILSSINYENVIKKRKDNFEYLNKELGYFNLLFIGDNIDYVPLVYPLLVEDDSLRNKLINSKIYVAKYWDDALVRATISSIEINFINNIIPLPIDQRYNFIDMQKIIDFIKGEINK